MNSTLNQTGVDHSTANNIQAIGIILGFVIAFLIYQIYLSYKNRKELEELKKQGS